MNLKILGANKTEMDLGNGLKVLWSYEIPVAYVKDGSYFKTSRFYSPTTSRHINSWIGDSDVTTVDQGDIDKAVA